MPHKDKAPDPRWQWKPKRKFRPRPKPRRPKDKTVICYGWNSDGKDSRLCRAAGCTHPAHRLVRVYPRKPDSKARKLRELRAIRAFYIRRTAEQWKYPKLEDVC
jgi:hypothetical protein